MKASPSGAVTIVARRRLTTRWRGLVVAGLLLGAGFGVSLASLAAARTTASAYERILVAADAPDAAVAHGRPLEEAVRSLDTVEGITGQRAYAGFLGIADGVDRALTTGLLASVDDRFPLELPELRDGRLPNGDAPDEVFVSATVADGTGLEVGDHLTFHLFTPQSDRTATTTVTVTGIGTVPVELVRDETTRLGVVVFTRAFLDAHRDLVAYSVSNVDLAPEVDARGELAALVGELGHELQSARSQEIDAVNEAMRPLVIVLVALGVLAFVATAIGAGQVVQRNLTRGRGARATLRAIGMERSQLRVVELATSAIVAVVAVIAALAVMVLTAPLAPVGPLHDLDPSRGRSIDLTVAAFGAAAIVLTLVALTGAAATMRTDAGSTLPRRSSWLATTARGPAAIAGITLALQPDRRGRAWRPLAATAAATGLLALCAAFVPSAVRLVDTPSSYGFDADLLALNAYGDQSADALATMFGESDDVVAATGFTLVPFLLDGRAVPGLAATSVKGELTPTILEGRPADAANEVVAGRDTLDAIGATIGDVVTAEISPGRTSELRVVGIATFPPVGQIGSDVPRLGTGVLVTRDAYVRMGGDRANQPEFTAVRLAAAADPTTMTARHFDDAARTTTTWFTDAEPAEIRQLDAAMPYLRGSLIVGYGALLAVAAHALWTRARANRQDLAVLRAVGCTGRQLDAVTMWQAFPAAVVSLGVGIPLGIALGRWTFSTFARSLAVVDGASTPPLTVGILVIAVLVAVGIAGLLGVFAARQTRASVALREVTDR